MSEQKNTLAELNQISDNDTITVKGRRYTVIAMPIAYVKEYLSEPRSFITSQDGNINLVMLNFMELQIPGKDGKEETVNMEKMLEKWIPRLLKFEGAPCTLSLLKEHEWGVQDIDIFLKKALLISG
jgi:hypothetical protein